MVIPANHVKRTNVIRTRDNRLIVYSTGELVKPIFKDRREHPRTAGQLKRAEDIAYQTLREVK